MFINGLAENNGTPALIADWFQSTLLMFGDKMDYKILLTGHTSPMGKELYAHLSKEYEVIGVSRESGYDLTKQEDVEKVVDMALDADLFINLAHVESAQSQMLIMINNKWNKESRLGLVISFGSLATKLDNDILRAVNIDKQYLADKHKLDAVNNSLANQKPFGEQCQFTLVRVLNYGEKTGDRSGEPTCTADDIIRTVDYIINEPMYVGVLDIRRF